MAILFNPACDSCSCQGGEVTYLGGDFFTFGGGATARIGVAKISEDGSLDTTWTPVLDEAVFAMVLDGGTLYIGGRFTTVNGSGRAGLAAIDAATGSLLSWNPGVSGGGAQVLAMAIDSAAGILYIGGDFTTLGGSGRNRAGAVSTAGVLQAWDPNLNNLCWDIAVATDVYLVGEFTTVSGGTVRRRGAAFTTGGVLQPFDPNITHTSFSAVVYDITINGSSVYVGGFFNTVGAATRNYLAEVNTAGAVQSFDPNMNADVRRLSVDTASGLIYVIGDFTTVGGVTRNRACALDSAATLQSWNPNLSAFSRTILVTGENVYVSGNFSTVGGIARTYAASVTTAGVLRSWNPVSDSISYAIVSE